MCNKHVSDIGSKTSLFNKLCKVVVVAVVVVVVVVAVVAVVVASVQFAAALKF